jgi:GNAT superfamily N-acetyltransferase
VAASFHLTLAAFEQRLCKINLKYHEFLERATDWERMDQYRKAASFPEYDRLSSYWHCHSLAVHPQHQRKRIASKLMKQGLDIAQEDQVPANLQASPDGRALYAKLGFKTIATRPICGEITSVMMLWEPKGSEGKWLDIKEDGSAVLKEDLKEDLESDHAS